MISLLSSERYCESNKPTRLGLNCLRIFARLVAEDQVPSPPVTKETPRSSFAKVDKTKLEQDDVYCTSLKTSMMLRAFAPTPAEIESPTAAIIPTCVARLDHIS